MFKYFVKVIIRNILKIFWIFPINPLKLCFQSFNGLQPTCNPLYIYQYLSKNHPEYKYVWLVNEIPEQKFENILYVKKHILRWIYEILTSKILITNSGFYSYLPFRKNSIIIETWHGGGAYKRVGTAFEAKNKRSNEFRSLEYYIRHLDYYISSSKKFTEIMSESTLIDKKKILPIGMPRNDIFFDSELTKKTSNELRKRFGFKRDDFIVLYAPTYRGEVRVAKFDVVIDVEKLKMVLGEKTKKNIIVLFRGHYLLHNHPCFSFFDKDVSEYPVMQELLCTSDMLITDYSSSMWDFSLLARPCFLFVPDLDEYVKKRGFYTEPNTWGFPICRTNTELEGQIISFDKAKYQKAIEKHHKDFGSYETGEATQKISDLIIEKIEYYNSIGKNNLK